MDVNNTPTVSYFQQKQFTFARKKVPEYFFKVYKLIYFIIVKIIFMLMHGQQYSLLF